MSGAQVRRKSSSASNHQPALQPSNICPICGQNRSLRHPPIFHSSQSISPPKLWQIAVPFRRRNPNRIPLCSAPSSLLCPFFESSIICALYVHTRRENKIIINQHRANVFARSRRCVLCSRAQQSILFSSLSGKNTLCEYIIISKAASPQCFWLYGSLSAGNT